MAPHVAKKPVVTALFEQNITIVDLIEVTGLHPNSVKHAVLGGGDRRIHVTVAQTIAEWLDGNWEDFEWPKEVTNEGRPALTGGTYQMPILINPHNVCTSCYTERSCAGTCLCA